MLVYLWDLEGTLTDTTHRIHFAKAKDWAAWDKAFPQDPPNTELVRIARILGGDPEGAKNIIVTGKDETGRDATRSWLARNEVPYHSIRMRPAGAFTMNNAAFKEQVLLKMLAESTDFFIRCAFDDMSETVAMYRRHGITCLQGQGHIEHP